MTAGRPWIVFVIAVVVAAVALVLRWPAAGPDSSSPATDGSEAGAAGNPAASYLEFAGTLAPESSLDSDMVVEGMRRLAGALGTLQDVPADVPLDLRVAAEHIVLNADAADTTAAVRNSLRAAAATLDGRGQGGEPITAIVDSIDPARPIGEQADTVRRVFTACADRLRPLVSAQ